jgi:hypothetical protein
MPITPAMEPASHPAIRAKLPRTIKKSYVPVPTTPSQRSITKRLNQRCRVHARALYNAALVTPLIARVPSLYYQPIPSSLHVFDHNFYNNQIMNGDISFKDTVYSAQTNR